MEVSVVIPTKDRPESLGRLLRCLAAQTYPLQETIIVDAGNIPAAEVIRPEEFPSLHIRYIRSVASVCIQKNTGIREAASPFVFLCDDDIEIAPSYVEKIMHFFRDNPSAQIVSGLVAEHNEKGEWLTGFRPGNAGLWHAFIFQLSVWTDVSLIPYHFLNYIPLYFLKKRKENGLSWAGWPVNTRFPSPSFTCTAYGLGVSIGKKELLSSFPFDEVLDPSGIGDNYLLSVSIPEPRPIHILTEITALHHRSPENRLAGHISYYRRILALHYALKTSPRFSRFNRRMLVWSLKGNFLQQLLQGRGKYMYVTFVLILRIITGRNPYIQGRTRGEKTIIPFP